MQDLKSALKDNTKIWQVHTSFGKIELMTATFYHQTFSKHSHDDFPVGVIEKGALSFYFRRANLVAPKGTVNLSYPGEIHNGQSHGKEGWRYRMFYFDLEVLSQIFREFKNRSSNLPFFPNGVIEDPYLTSFLGSLHREIEKKQLSALTLDSYILHIISYLIFKHSDQNCYHKQSNPSPSYLNRAIEYINNNIDQNITLHQLSEIVGISPYHFSRVFLNRYGITPHAYQIQTRIKKARQMLFSKNSLAEIALDTGFNDQSHFTRRFKQILGYTPQQYRKIIQA